MADRLCVTGCGNILGINRSQKCRNCREKKRTLEQQAAHQKRFEERKVAGLILLHSCLSNGLLDPITEKCLCRKLITVQRAQHLIEIGRCVDLEKREACFHGGPIVEKSRLKCPPISSLGQRIAIERRTELNEKDIAHMKAMFEQEKALRDQERSLKIDIEHEIAVEEQTKLIRVYSDEQWLQMERTFSLHRGFCDGIGHDERTLGGTGVDRSCHYEVLEIEDDAPATNIESEDNTSTEFLATDYDSDTNTEVEFESFEDLTETEAA